MMTIDDVQQIDPELVEGGRSVGFYAHTRCDDETFFWSVALPMAVEDHAFEDLLPEWRRLGWRMLTQQSG